MVKLKRGMLVAWWYYSTQMIEGAVRHHFGDYLSKAEVVIYSVLAVLLSLTALVGIASAARRKQPLMAEHLSHFPEALIPGTNTADLLKQ